MAESSNLTTSTVCGGTEKFHFCAELNTGCQVTLLAANLYLRGPSSLIMMLPYYMESFKFIPGTLLHLISSGNSDMTFCLIMADDGGTEASVGSPAEGD